MFQFLVQSTPINHFLSEILEFLFSQQIFQVGKFKDGDFKYENIYSNSDSKILKSYIFGPNLKDFYFCTQYSNKANSRNAILIMTIFFPNFSLKILNKGFLVKNNQIRLFLFKIEAFLFFCEIFQLDKFECADFKYENIIFK